MRRCEWVGLQCCRQLWIVLELRILHTIIISEVQITLYRREEATIMEQATQAAYKHRVSTVGNFHK